MTTPIPQPPTIPFLGNVTAIDKELPLRSFALLAEKYGEIYQLNVLGMTASNSMTICSKVSHLSRSSTGNPTIFVTTYALVHEVSDEKRFKKTIRASLNEVRNLVDDGLFTVRITVHYPVPGA
jgi:cytochrome P450/NADPH-cytochrome P450 reductase